uniref:RHS repeat-associated core domain-containing protein n=1 Tax=Gordonia sp. B7-2 TaxID=3420932 RepID=UPI003D8BB8C6
MAQTNIAHTARGQVPAGAASTWIWTYHPDTGEPLEQHTRHHTPTHPGSEGGSGSGSGGGGRGGAHPPAGGDPVGWSQAQIDDEFHAIVADLSDAPTELVDPASGQVVGRATRTVWGDTRWQGVGTPLRFAGQQYDPETGLHYNRYRYYNPATTTYTSPDPLGIAPNPYSATAYVHNPHTWIDPLGLKPCLRGIVNMVHDAGLRVGYNRAAKGITKRGLADLRSGGDPESIARRVVGERNDLKQLTRDKMWNQNAVARMAERNVGKYGNPIGPTFEKLAESRSPVEIIEGGSRTASWRSVLNIVRR